jgi:hypothetical protein
MKTNENATMKNRDRQVAMRPDHGKAACGRPMATARLFIDPVTKRSGPLRCDKPTSSARLKPKMSLNFARALHRNSRSSSRCFRDLAQGVVHALSAGAAPTRWSSNTRKDQVGCGAVPARPTGRDQQPISAAARLPQPRYQQQPRLFVGRTATVPPLRP